MRAFLILCCFGLFGSSNLAWAMGSPPPPEVPGLDLTFEIRNLVYEFTRDPALDRPRGRAYQWSSYRFSMTVHSKSFEVFGIDDHETTHPTQEIVLERASTPSVEGFMGFILGHHPAEASQNMMGLMFSMMGVIPTRRGKNSVSVATISAEARGGGIFSSGSRESFLANQALSLDVIGDSIPEGLLETAIFLPISRQIFIYEQQSFYPLVEIQETKRTTDIEVRMESDGQTLRVYIDEAREHVRLEAPAAQNRRI